MFLSIRREPVLGPKWRLLLGAGIAVLAVAGCASSGSTTPDAVADPVGETLAEPVLIEFPSYPDVRVVEDVRYGQAGDTSLLLDVCLPPETTAPIGARPAVLVVHGGSWSRGDKAEPHWRSVCEWLANDGFVTFNINYRLAPQWTFPAAPDDVRAAVAWMRQPAQVERFGIDPARIGAFGGSAGGNLVALLGTEGTGPLTEGTRVAAVAELSGPADLTGSPEYGLLTPDFASVQATYLGCVDATQCPVAEAASPRHHIDPSDPPFFIGHAADERVPLEQSRSFATALESAGVDVTLTVVDGALHSVALLDDVMRGAIRDFLVRALA
jgi:acetyl esterase